MRAKPQRRKGAKASGSQTERTTIPLRLGVFARVKKKKELVFPQCYGTGSRNSAGQVANASGRQEHRMKISSLFKPHEIWCSTRFR
jgi:hypothetical protein